MTQRAAQLKTIVAVLIVCQMSASLVSAAETPSPVLVDVKRIWDKAPHNAFTDLIRFRDRWYCVFREARNHWGPGARGEVRIVTSDDGSNWKTAGLFSDPELGDPRDPKLSIHPDGKLMVIYFRRFNPTRFPEKHERQYMRLSADGTQWTDAVEIGFPDRWLWRITWHEGNAYGVSHGGPADKPPFTGQRSGRLVVSEDGKQFKPLVGMAYGGESTIRFLPDGKALCLRRSENNQGLLGISSPPYQDWAWKDLDTTIGGPNFIRLPDGRLVAVVRLYDGERRTSLCRLDPDEGTLTETLALPSGGDTSYAGLVWHDDLLWISYYSSHEGKAAIYLARVRFAPPRQERRYLAVDRSLHARLQNLTVKMGHASHEQVLWRQFDEPWEKEYGLRLGSLGNVIRDHEGRYRMYYEVMRSNTKRATAVAFSEDGVDWTKPKLNLARNILDDPASNLIRVDAPEKKTGRGLLDGKWYRGAHAFHDRHASSPERRYKLMWRQGHDIYVASSEDGLHFITHGQAVDYYADTTASYFFDRLRDEYVIYGRVWLDRAGRRTVQERLGADGKPPVRRGVVRHRSKKWHVVPWPKGTVKEVLIDPIDVFEDGGWTDIYTPDVQVYHGQYVGMPAVYFRRPLEDRSATAGPIYPLFMHSLDGRTWDFPDKSHSVVDLEPHRLEESDGNEVGMIFPASNFLEADGHLRMYYAARGYQHHDQGDRSDVTYNLAVLRKDGFASLQTEGDQPGVWLTPELTIPETATTLHVNADVSKALRVAVLDAETRKPLEGLAEEDYKAFAGDDTDAAIEWESKDLDGLRGRLVRLRFRITEGEMFGFSFQ